MPNLTVTTTCQDHASCYRALCARDSRFDGEFFVGVSSTGIYCRPVCRVKTPRASSCTFFPNASAAEAAGFRPCLRCRPELAPYAIQQNLAYAIWQRIAAGALNFGASMQDLAQQVGLSTRQLQRLMQQHFGVSPIELAQTARLLFAKKLLQETGLSMAEIAYASGFGSVRRFNALFSSRYGMTPGALRRTKTNTANLLTLRLAYRAPYAWDAMLDYLASRGIAGVETVGSDAAGRYYARSVRMPHGAEQIEGWFKVSHLSKEQQLEVQVGHEFTPVLMQLLDKIREQFDLDANPAVIEQHLRNDALLAKQLVLTPGLRVPGTFSHIELGLRAVLGQQISVAGASTLAARLVRQFGAPARTPFEGITHYFPDARLLAELSVERMAQIGVPKARAGALIALSQFAIDYGLKPAPGASLAQAVARLKPSAGSVNGRRNTSRCAPCAFPTRFRQVIWDCKKPLRATVLPTG